MVTKTKECLEKVEKSGEKINTVGDTKLQLKNCEKIFSEELQSHNISGEKALALKKQFQTQATMVLQQKSEEIQERHNIKGQFYGENKPHVKSGQKALYKSLKKPQY